MDEMCNISNIYRPPGNIPKLSYFYTRHFIYLHHLEKNDDIHRKSFLKHPLCTTFSLFWKVSEVCNILNKCWLPNKSVNKIFLNKTPYTPPLLQKHKTPYTPPSFEKKMRSPSQILLETYTFHHIFSSFYCGWGVQYFK